MTPEQRDLLEDKIRIWREESKWGNMDLRDYNRRCADALEAALTPAPSSEGELLNEAGKRLLERIKAEIHKGSKGGALAALNRIERIVDNARQGADHA